MKQHRFVLLDGLRGVAACVVLTFHLVQQHSLTALPFAGLGVDFFYMLSGFVVAFAYETRLQSGAMRLASFARVRLTRLYPLVLLGTLAGIALALLAASFKGNVTYQEVAVSGVLALLLLPSYVFPQWDTAYPFNMASWSLTFELFINAVYAVLAPVLTTRRLVQLTGCTALLLIWLAIATGGIYGGNNQSNFFYGFARVPFPFFAGVLLYRIRLPPFIAHRVGGGLIVGLGAVLLAPVDAPGSLGLVYVLLVFPAVIATGAAVTVGPALSKACWLAGQLSYPIYILQGPILRVGEEVLKYRPFEGGDAWLFGAAEACLVVAVAWTALTLYDEPLQAIFKRRVRPALAEPSAPLPSR